MFIKLECFFWNDTDLALFLFGTSWIFRQYLRNLDQGGLKLQNPMYQKSGSPSMYKPIVNGIKAI